VLANAAKWDLWAMPTHRRSGDAITIAIALPIALPIGSTHAICTTAVQNVDAAHAYTGISNSLVSLDLAPLGLRPMCPP